MLPHCLIDDICLHVFENIYIVIIILLCLFIYVFIFYIFLNLFLVFFVLFLDQWLKVVPFVSTNQLDLDL